MTTSRLSTYIVVAILSIMSVRAACAQANLASISAMVGELNAAKAEEGALGGQSSALEEQAAAKEKELKVYADQVEPLRAAYAQLKTARVDPHNADANKQHAAVAQHNAKCAGKTLPRPAYDQCMGEDRELRAWKERVDTRKGKIDQEAAALDKKRDNIAARAKVLESELKRIRESQQRLARARQRIATLTGRLQAICSRGIPTNTSLEEIKVKCGNVQFDGAKNYPPCDTEACKEFDRMQARR